MIKDQHLPFHQKTLNTYNTSLAFGILEARIQKWFFEISTRKALHTMLVMDHRL